RPQQCAQVARAGFELEPGLTGLDRPIEPRHRVVRRTDVVGDSRMRPPVEERGLERPRCLSLQPAKAQSPKPKADKDQTNPCHFSRIRFKVAWRPVSFRRATTSAAVSINRLRHQGSPLAS